MSAEGQRKTYFCIHPLAFSFAVGSMGEVVSYRRRPAVVRNRRLTWGLRLDCTHVARAASRGGGETRQRQAFSARGFVAKIAERTDMWMWGFVAGGGGWTWACGGYQQDVRTF